MMIDKAKNLEEIMSIDIDNLAQKQYDAYRSYVVEVMEQITDDIRNEKYEEIKIAYSPAGDAYGRENMYIDFDAYKCIDEDIGDVLNRLSKLKENCKHHETKNMTFKTII